MITLTVDKAMLDLLSKANGPAVLQDEAGAVVGVFSPAKPPAQGPVRPKVGPQQDEAALLADLERRAQDPGPDRTFSQAFERLLSLTDDPTQQAMLRKQIDCCRERERCDSPS
jgi:hypothetical protein